MNDQPSGENQYQFETNSPTQRHHTPNRFSSISQPPSLQKNHKNLFIILTSVIVVVIITLIIVLIILNSNDKGSYDDTTVEYKSVQDVVIEARKDTSFLQLYGALNNESTIGEMKDYTASISGAQLIIYDNGTGKIQSRDGDEFISFYYVTPEDDNEVEETAVIEEQGIESQNEDETEDISEDDESEDISEDDGSEEYEGPVVVEDYDLSTPVYGIAYIRAIEPVDDNNLAIVYYPEEDKYLVGDIMSDPVEFNTKQGAIDYYLNPDY